MFGTLIDYWHLTGDTTYNKPTMQAMMHQISPTGDWMPENQTRSLGNDDQGFWAMAAMTAAENKFPDPPSDKPQWLGSVQSVFNEYTTRWSETECGGGLRWQVFSFNVGFDYKNSISNGCFFNIAARLARYTGNQTYADWATKVFAWEQKVGIITNDMNVYDGAHIDAKTNKCTHIDKILWTYNHGIYMHGCAAMYSVTKDEKWKTRVDGLLKTTTSKFLNQSIIYEQLCEPYRTCNNDQSSFKGYLARYLASTSQLAPHTAPEIRKILATSGAAAAAACTGPASDKFKGFDGTACGFSWVPKGTFDGLVGVGEQMNALAAVVYNLAKNAKPPVTKKTGGTSKEDPGGGVDDATRAADRVRAITSGDKAAATFITALMLAGFGGMMGFLIYDW